MGELRELSDGTYGSKSELVNCNIEVAKTLNVSVSAGATVTVIDSVKVSNFRRAYAFAVAKTAEPHNFTLKVEHDYIGGTSGMYNVSDGSTSAVATSASRVNTGQFDIKSQYLRITITNSDASPHSYDVFLGGIR